jgi:hypothetical protein
LTSPLMTLYKNTFPLPTLTYFPLALLPPETLFCLLIYYTYVSILSPAIYIP